MENKEVKTINIKFNKENHLKFQKEIEKRRYDKETKSFKIIYDQDGNALKEVKSYISLPSTAIYKDKQDNEISLKGFLFETTTPLFTPHKFDQNGNDLGADDKYLMLKLYPNTSCKISKTDFKINDEGKKEYDFENQIVYYVKPEEIKEFMDSWKTKEFNQDYKEHNNASSLENELEM